ncbi:MAG TPA: AAA family ATPase [Mogibacterium sp.]|nr:AAA family ATPase [Mogibacterium sp.]
MISYIFRTRLRKCIDFTAHFPVVVVSGARQTGKTTLVKETFGLQENVIYVTLDYPRIRNLAKTGPLLSYRFANVSHDEERQRVISR